MAYEDFKNLARRTASDKVLREKAFNIAKNPKYDGYQRSLASRGYNFVDKKTTSFVRKSAKGSGFATRRSQQLAEELHKPIIRKFKKRQGYSLFKDNIWGADLADMQLIYKFNKGIHFLLYVIDIFNKQVWVVPLKNKKGITATNAFHKILDKSKRKPNEL